MTDRHIQILLVGPGSRSIASTLVEGLEDTCTDSYEMLSVADVADAAGAMRAREIDIAFVDVRDSGGDASVIKTIHAAADTTPVIALTGSGTPATDMVAAGATDCLEADAIRPELLRQLVGIAVARQQQAAAEERERTLAEFRSLSHRGRSTRVTAALSGVQRFEDRFPSDFAELLNGYCTLFEDYVEHLAVQREKPRDAMEAIVARVGDAGAGPQDLVDLHLTALDHLTNDKASRRARSLVIQGRLLALEMMGLLVDYYRIGLKRRSDGGSQA